MNTSFAAQRRALSVREFCILYGVSRPTVYRLIAEKTLSSVRIGGRRLIPVDAAEQLLRPAEG